MPFSVIRQFDLGNIHHRLIGFVLPKPVGALIPLVSGLQLHGKLKQGHGPMLQLGHRAGECAGQDCIMAEAAHLRASPKQTSLVIVVVMKF